MVLWVPGRSPASVTGLLVNVVVASDAATVELVVANGGQIVQPIGVDALEITALFRDLACSVIGLYQESV